MNIVSTVVEPGTVHPDALQREHTHTHTCEKSGSESHSVVSGSLRPTCAMQSMGFSRPEHWSGWPFPSPGDLPNPGIEARSPALQADSLLAEPQGKPTPVRLLAKNV